MGITTRAAFDIGSGAIRLQVADVNRQKEKIERSHCVAYRSIGFARDLKVNGGENFSQEIIDGALAAVKELKELASSWSPHEYCGIATEAFRTSKNSPAVVARILEETGVSIAVVSHQEEAYYGFLNALCHSSLAAVEVISWDSGAGSFQITCSDGVLFLARLGRIPVQHYIIETLQKRDFSTAHSPNPISKRDALKAIEYIKTALQPIPEMLKRYLAVGKVLALGAHSRLIPTHTEYTQDDVKTLLFDNLNKSDGDFDSDEPHYIVSDLILEYGVMCALGITKAYRLSTKESGNTSGVLIHPKLWQ